MTAAAPGGADAPAIVVCADDFGLSEAGSAVIVELLAGGALNATSCLVEAAAWPKMAGPLRQAVDRRPGLAVGLHLNLTEALPGCAAPEALASIPVQLLRSLAPEADGRRAAILEALRAQWSRFVEAFGRPPDFIDGHEHVHLAPIARGAVFQLLGETGFNGWIRQCRTSSARANWKRAVLDPLSAALADRARRRRVACNPGFGGLRRFRTDEDVERLWRIDLAAMAAGGVLMTHPGAAESGDPVGEARAQEAGLFFAGGLSRALEQAGARLAADAVRPW